MSIKLLVQEVIRTGWLRISQEVELLGALRGGARFSPAEFRLLLKLQEALRAGEVLIGERKKCVNVMEELVRDAVLAELLLRGLDEAALPDLGDIAAYALNRLPPAYATTQEGYAQQRARVLKTSSDRVRKIVEEAVDRVLSVPVSRPEGATPLGTVSGAEAAETLRPVATELNPADTV
jgi:hypothetical protein